MENKRDLLSEFYKKYKNVMFSDEESKKELKELASKLLPDIMENKDNVAITILKDFFKYLKEYKTGVISKEKMKSIIKWYRDIFGDEILGTLIKKYISDDEVNACLFPLINELNLQNIIGCAGGI